MKKSILAIALLISSHVFSQTVEQGLKYIDIERYTSAKNEFNKVLEKSPNDANALYYLGDLALRDNDLTKAKEYFDKGVAAAHKNPLNYVGLGTIEWINGNADAAKVKFDLATSFGKRNAIMYYKIAEAYAKYEKKNYDLAVSILKEKALVYDRNMIDAHVLLGDIYLWQSNGSAAAENYNNALNVNPNSAKTLIRKGQIYVYSKNYTEGLNLFIKGVQADSTYSPGYRELGELYIKAGRSKEALENYKKFIERSDDDIKTKLNYGQFLYSAKDYLKAIEVLKNVQTQLDKPIINRILGYSYFETGDFTSSKNSLDAFFAKEEQKNYIALDYEYLGKAYAKLNNDSLSIIQFDKAYTLDTSKVQLLSTIGDTYFKARKYQKAADSYEKYVNQRPKGFKELLSLGISYYLLKDQVKADTILGKLIAAAPKSPSGYIWRARVKEQIDLGKTTPKLWLAKPFFEKFIELSKGDITKYKAELLEAYSFMGYHYVSVKDCTNGLVYWNKVKEIDATNKYALDNIKKCETGGAKK